MSTLKLPDELALCQAWLDRKDLAARNKVVEANLVHIEKLAVKVDRKRGHVDDLYLIGCEVFIRHLDKFDPSRGLRPLTYARSQMFRAMNDHLSAVSSCLSGTGSAVFRRVRGLVSSGKDSEARQYKSYPEIVGALRSIDSGSRGPCPVDDLTPFDAACLSEGRTLITGWIAELPARQQKVVSLLWFSDERPTFRDVAAVLGVSAECVRLDEVRARTFILARLRGSANV